MNLEADTSIRGPERRKRRLDSRRILQTSEPHIDSGPGALGDDVGTGAAVDHADVDGEPDRRIGERFQ